jgi:hypothetical protein
MPVTSSAAPRRTPSHLGQTRPSVYAARDCDKRNCTHGDEGNHTQGAATVHRGLFYNEIVPDEEILAVTVFARFADGVCLLLQDLVQS